MLVFLCDEASSLGKFEPITHALDKFRSYDIHLILIYQSIGQLKECWPNGGEVNLMSNTSQVFFAVQDKDTAEHVSTRLGEYTTIIESGGTSAGGSYQRNSKDWTESNSTSWNRNDNWGLHGRKLLRPEEVATMNPRLAITFTAGIPPILTWLPRYYEPRPPVRNLDIWLVAFVWGFVSMMCVLNYWR